MKKYVVCVLVLLVPHLLLGQESMRTWTNQDGRTLEARMLSASDERVTVMTAGGETHIISLATLSEEDQAYARQGASGGRGRGSSRGERKAEWHTSLDRALAESEDLDKPVLMLFTGSDWCPPCIRLERNVFSESEFQEFANEHLVLLMVDFPRRRSLSARQQTANRELASEHGIRGYPTMVLANHEGKGLDKFGYGGQDVEGFKKFLEQKLAGLK